MPDHPAAPHKSVADVVEAMMARFESQLPLAQISDVVHSLGRQLTELDLAARIATLSRQAESRLADLVAAPRLAAS
jgi:hypothetical protein